MLKPVSAALLAFALGLPALPAAAATLGQVDTFQGGAMAGWTSGEAHPTPPTLSADGGPLGAGDSFLQLTATGIQGPGGKLVALNGAQWAGDYLAAGVTGILMDLRNFGSTDLSLRLYFLGTAGTSALSSTAVVLPAGGGWTPVYFAIDPAALTGTLIALGSVSQLRLYHGTSAAYPGQNIVSQLGVDNVAAVPEPGAGALLAAGLAMVVAALRRRAPPGA